MKLIKGILDLLMAAFILMGMLLSVPKLWGFQIYAVTSGSMEPEIHTGDADPVWITRDTVRGEVKHVMPGLGYLALMAATLSGKLFLMAVFLWMIAAKIAVSGVHMIYLSRKRLPFS